MFIARTTEEFFDALEVKFTQANNTIGLEFVSTARSMDDNNKLSPKMATWMLKNSQIHKIQMPAFLEQECRTLASQIAPQPVLNIAQNQNQYQNIQQQKFQNTRQQPQPLKPVLENNDTTADAIKMLAGAITLFATVLEKLVPQQEEIQLAEPPKRGRKPKKTGDE